MIIKECIDCAIGNKEKVASCPNDDDDLAIDNDDDDCPMRKKLPPSLIARSVTIQLPRCQQDMSAGQKRWLCRMCSTNTQIYKYTNTQIYKYTNTVVLRPAKYVRGTKEADVRNWYIWEASGKHLHCFDFWCEGVVHQVLSAFFNKIVFFWWQALKK